MFGKAGFRLPGNRKNSDSKINAVLDLAAQVYAGLSDQQIAEIESITLKRGNFF